MNDEKLIECVRKYEFIYNLKHPKYMDTTKKEIAWKDIGEQLKQPAMACKQRWQCLRDAFRRALNKKKLISGEAAKNIKPWKYETEMAFLAQFFVERKSLDPATKIRFIEILSDDEKSDNGDDNDAAELTSSENFNYDIEMDETIVGNSNLEDVEKRTQLKENNKISKAVKRKAVDLEQSTSTLETETHDDHIIEQPRRHDELDRFFLSISDTVKRFSPYQQALAKNKIFNIVSQMELQQLAPSSSTSSLKSEFVKVELTNGN